MTGKRERERERESVEKRNGGRENKELNAITSKPKQNTRRITRSDN